MGGRGGPSRKPLGGGDLRVLCCSYCCCLLLLGQSVAAKKNLTPTAHVAVDMGSQFLKVSAEQSVRGETCHTC
jgi:hypothetical protein